MAKVTEAATPEINETEAATPEIKATDPWKEMRTIFLERARGAEQNFVLVGVNGQQWKVPRGKMVEVPLPLWERLTIMQEREQKAYEARQRVNDEALEASRQLMRVR